MKDKFCKLVIGLLLSSLTLYAEQQVDVSDGGSEEQSKTQFAEEETPSMGGNIAQVSSEPIRQRDIDALRDLINTKRQVTIRELGGRLSLSGEVRTELQSTNEKKNAQKQRGAGGAVIGVPTRAYDIDANILLDYRSDKTWAAIKLRFDNDAGTFSGTANRLSLERALFGVYAIQGDTFTTSFIFGRNRLGNTFDSRIQFGSFMDGILLRYTHALDFLGDLYVYTGPFVINELRDQYGWVGEIGILNMFNSGFYTKYSVIDWDTKNFQDPVLKRRFDFLNSQLIIGYKFVPKRLNKSVTCYAAGLYNHAASNKPLVEKNDAGEIIKEVNITNGQRANWATYLGFSIGEARKAGDWSLDMNYQWVAAQAVPEFDSTGIGRGNAARVGFYTVRPDGTGGINNRKDAVGATNFKGLSIELLYLLTDNLTLYQGWRQSVTLDKSIGPLMRYKQYEIELVYVF